MLDFLSQNSLICKNLSYSNVLYDKEGNIAYIYDLRYLFVPQNFVYKAHFKLPELADNMHMTPQSDIFTYGLMLASLLGVKIIKTDDDINIIISNTLDKLSLALISTDGLTKIARHKIYMFISNCISYELESRHTIDSLKNNLDELINVCRDCDEENIFLYKSFSNRFVDYAFNQQFSPERIRHISPTINNSANGLEQESSLIQAISSFEFEGKSQVDDFYRTQLEREYTTIYWQRNITFILWALSYIGIGVFFAIAAYNIYHGNWAAGFFISLINIGILACKRLFKIRENQYSAEINRKLEHLEKIDSYSFALRRAGQIKNTAIRDNVTKSLIMKY